MKAKMKVVILAAVASGTVAAWRYRGDDKTWAPSQPKAVEESTTTNEPSKPIKSTPTESATTPKDSIKHRKAVLAKISTQRKTMTETLSALKELETSDQDLDAAIAKAAALRKEITGKIVRQEEMKNLSADQLAKLEEANAIEAEASAIHREKVQQISQRLTANK